MKFVIFCCLLVTHLCLAGVEGFTCENISDSDWKFAIGIQKTCFSSGITVFDWSEVFISPFAYESIGALSFKMNKKVKFLPLNVAEKFANIVAYSAYNCSVETITKLNFKALSKLRNLYLAHNKIEKVPSNAFDDLSALEVLSLNNNKIKFINSAAFERLSKLSQVELTENVCIQGYYQSADSVTSMITTLTDKCGFSEDPYLDEFSRKTTEQVSQISKSIASYRKEQQEEANNFKSLLSETKAEMAKSRNENTRIITSFETELNAAKLQNRALQSEGQRRQIVNAKLMTQVHDLEKKLAESESLCENELNAEKAKQTNTEKLQATLSELQISNAQREGEVKTLHQQMEHKTLELKNTQNACQAENIKNLIKIDQQATMTASLTTQNEILSNNFKKINDNFKECQRDKANLDVNLKLVQSKLDIFIGINITEIR